MQIALRNTNPKKGKEYSKLTDEHDKKNKSTEQEEKGK
jgi:hypothetical protein